MQLTLSRIRNLVKYPLIFTSVSDVVAYRKLLSRDEFGGSSEIPLVVRPLGSKVQYCRPRSTDAVVLWDTYSERYHLPDEALSNPKVILDLGANAGYTAAHFACLYPTARVIAVEMDARNARVARMNVEPWQDRVTLINAAVWVEDGTIEYAGEEEWGFHIVEHAPASKQTKKSAPARSIDSLLAEHQVDRVDFLKMDIEGAEDDVLAKAGAWLAKVQSMKVELHSQNASYERAEQVLSKAGFTCWRDRHHDNCLAAVRK